MPVVAPPCRPRLGGRAVLAVGLLFGVSLPAIAGGAHASAATCPISVASYGHTVAAAESALKAVSSSCRTIVFPAGTYVFSKSFRIGVSSVTVTAQSGAVIKPASGARISGSLIAVNASHVSLNNLTLDAPGNSTDGIHSNSPNTVINGTSVNVGGRAIYMLSHAADASISNCTVRGFGDRGVLTQAARTNVTGCSISGGRGTGLWSFSGADHPQFTNNTISGNGLMGIEFSTSRDFRASGNIIHDNRRVGIHSLRSNTGTITGNTIYRNLNNGIDLHGSTYVTVDHNKVYLNGGPRFPDTLEGQGIILFCSQHVQILSNTVWDNSQSQPGNRNGIHISDSNGTRPNEMATRYVVIDGNLSYDDQSRHTQGWAIHLGGTGAKSGDLNYITVTNNRGYGNVNAGLFTKGLAPRATVKISNNSLT